MTLRKLGWIVGGIGFLCLAGALVLFSLKLFTDVLDETEEVTLYECTACLKEDPSKCRTVGSEGELREFTREGDARLSAAGHLCDAVVPNGEDHMGICLSWVSRREQIFDIRCVSRLVRRKHKGIGMRVH